MLNNDFLAEDMLIRNIFLGVYLRKCLIFLWLIMVWIVYLVRNIHFYAKMSYFNLEMLKNDGILY